MNALEQNGDISVTKFLSDDQIVTQHMNGDQNMTIIQFLEDTLRENDISITKFLDYLNRYADLETRNILMAEFLDTAVSDYLQ